MAVRRGATRRQRGHYAHSTVNIRQQRRGYATAMLPTCDGRIAVVAAARRLLLLYYYYYYNIIIINVRWPHRRRRRGPRAIGGLPLMARQSDGDMSIYLQC